ncbi:hypothetical protein Dda_5442 [Drechslerella dactyloides]|uniref:Uncharacterized protein n=1 Tax=Drechslerella dactyloides TaxID=74499 RepID=A0AAD6J0B4_DREDA|nr:hypothetical protein Dda_5442 [Drechslerella dactyloides]
MNDSPTGNSKLVEITPTWVLALALYAGDVVTASILLKSGMKRRLNEALDFPRFVRAPWLSGSSKPRLKELRVLWRKLQQPILTVFDIAFCQFTLSEVADSLLQLPYRSFPKYAGSVESSGPSPSDSSFDEDDQDDGEDDNRTWSCKSSTHGSCQCNRGIDEDGESDEWIDEDDETGDEADDSDNEYVPLDLDQLASGKYDDEGSEYFDDSDGEGDDEESNMNRQENEVDERLGAITFIAGIPFGARRDFGLKFRAYHSLSKDHLSPLLKQDVFHVPAEILKEIEEILQS